MTMPHIDQNPGMLSLREAMYRLLEESFLTPPNGAGGDLPMPVDLAESRDALVAWLALPGVQPDDIDVTIMGDTLTVRGELREHPSAPGSRFHLREQRHGTFSRSIPLPVPVQAEAVRAEYEHGMLILTMPKLEQVRPRSIAITSRAASPAEGDPSADA